METPWRHETTTDNCLHSRGVYLHQCYKLLQEFSINTSTSMHSCNDFPLCASSLPAFSSSDGKHSNIVQLHCISILRRYQLKFVCNIRQQQHLSPVPSEGAPPRRRSMDRGSTDVPERHHSHGMSPLSHRSCPPVDEGPPLCFPPFLHPPCCVPQVCLDLF